MNSFLRDHASWHDQAARLAPLTAEIERRRAKFGDVGRRLRRAARAIGVSGLPGSDAGFTLHLDEPEPIDPAEALAFGCDGHGAGAWDAYRAVARTIRRGHAGVRFSTAWLKVVHRRLHGGDGRAGRWREGELKLRTRWGDGVSRDAVQPAPSSQVAPLMAELHGRFDDLRRRSTALGLLPAAAWVLDMLAIHPFGDANGRTSRLAALLLLYQAGHPLGDHFSLEGAFARRRPAHHAALRRSLAGWTEGRHDLEPWCRFVLTMVNDGYREVEARAARLEAWAGGERLRLADGGLSIAGACMEEVGTQVSGVGSGSAMRGTGRLSGEGPVGVAPAPPHESSGPL